MTFGWSNSPGTAPANSCKVPTRSGDATPLSVNVRRDSELHRTKVIAIGISENLLRAHADTDNDMPGITPARRFNLAVNRKVAECPMLVYRFRPLEGL